MYTKIMRERYWFRKQKHKAGWVPSSWEGWFVMILYLAALVYAFIEIDSKSHSVSDTLFSFVPKFLIFSALLFIIAYLKGEPTASPSHEHSEPVEAE